MAKLMHLSVDAVTHMIFQLMVTFFHGLTTPCDLGLSLWTA